MPQKAPFAIASAFSRKSALLRRPSRPTTDRSRVAKARTPERADAGFARRFLRLHSSLCGESLRR